MEVEDTQMKEVIILLAELSAMTKLALDLHLSPRSLLLSVGLPILFTLSLEPFKQVCQVSTIHDETYFPSHKWRSQEVCLEAPEGPVRTLPSPPWQPRWSL